MSGETKSALVLLEDLSEDEAIAAILATVPPGTPVTIHEEDCSMGDDPDECDCDSVTLVTGAAA